MILVIWWGKHATTRVYHRNPQNIGYLIFPLHIQYHPEIMFSRFFIWDETTYLGPFKWCLIWLSIVFLTSKFLFQRDVPWSPHFWGVTTWGNHDDQHQFQWSELRDFHSAPQNSAGENNSCHRMSRLESWEQQFFFFFCGEKHPSRLPWICAFSMIELSRTSTSTLEWFRMEQKTRLTRSSGPWPAWEFHKHL